MSLIKKFLFFKIDQKNKKQKEKYKTQNANQTLTHLWFNPLQPCYNHLLQAL